MSESTHDPAAAQAAALRLIALLMLDEQVRRGRLVATPVVDADAALAAHLREAATALGVWDATATPTGRPAAAAICGAGVGALVWGCTRPPGHAGPHGAPRAKGGIVEWNAPTELAARQAPAARAAPAPPSSPVGTATYGDGVLRVAKRFASVCYQSGGALSPRGEAWLHALALVLAGTHPEDAMAYAERHG